MIKEPQLMLFDLAVCLSDAMDLVSSSLVNHHKQVAYISTSIAEEMGLGEDVQKDLILAGALHDIGALSLEERIDTLRFEITNPVSHTGMGSVLLKLFTPLASLAPIVKHHHVFWNRGRGEQHGDEEVPLAAHIIHCADRIAVLIEKDKDILSQERRIIGQILEQKDTMFHPKVVDGFVAAATKERFWLDAVSPTIYRMLRRRTRLKTLMLTLEELKDLATFFSHIIDFRSSFTATHSCGVSASAEMLARLVGFSKRECEHMAIAGHVHDLGKLAVPREILEKPGSLTTEEFNVIRTHTYHTHRLLDTLDGFDTINQWASFHHERLDGKGYPFHHHGDVLPLGSRIMCVADVFTAISEDRPYRKGMGRSEVMSVINGMAEKGLLDKMVVDVAIRNIDGLNETRASVQRDSATQYAELMACCNEAG
jgi:HD-GYP domain-containing protein (c-di-GMP phosphodiesterase class II)